MPTPGRSRRRPTCQPASRRFFAFAAAMGHVRHVLTVKCSSGVFVGRHQGLPHRRVIGPANDSRDASTGWLANHAGLTHTIATAVRFFCPCRSCAAVLSCRGRSATGHWARTGPRGLAGSPSQNRAGPAALIGFSRTCPLAGLRVRPMRTGQPEMTADKNVCPTV